MRREPRWLSLEECLAVHDLMLSDYGGLTGVRDLPLLESALAQPRQLYRYDKPALPELAAAYTAGILQNHPFFDGNKRTGFMLGAGFLELNGWNFIAAEADAAVATLALAAGEWQEATYAAWMQANARPA